MIGKSQLTNTNKLIRTYKGATGLKTGSTALALYNLSASATRDNLSLIAVIMKAPSTKVRFEEARKLLDYGFNNFSFKELEKKGDVATTIQVNKGVDSSLDIVFEKDAGILIEKGKDNDIKQVLDINQNISAPIQEGQILGTMSYMINDEVVSSCNLIAKNSVDKINIFTTTKKIIYRWIDLLRT